MTNLTLSSQEQSRSASEYAAEAFDKLVIALTAVLAMVALLAVA
jgi:hypothetical protein